MALLPSNLLENVPVRIGVVLQSGQLIVGDALGWIHWLDANNGQIVGRIQVDASGVAMTPVRVGQNWVVVTRSGLVQALRAE